MILQSIANIIARVDSKIQ